MPIPFTCPHCGTVTDAADQYAGQSGPCVSCGKMVAAPLPNGGSPFGGGAPPKRGLGAGMTALIVIAVAVPVLLTCLSIVAVLMALLLPAVQAAREAARRAQCTNNLKQIGLAMHNYHRANGCFPPAFIADKNGKPMHSWRVLLLPYLDEQALYSQYRMDEPWDSPHNAALAQRMPSVYYCPSEPGPRVDTSYAMLVGPHCISDGPTAHRMADITDGGSNTVMVAECYNAGINWMEPRDIDTQTMPEFGSCKPRGPCGGPGIGSCHFAIANFLYCDGSVRAISSSTDEEVLDDLMKIDKKANTPPPGAPPPPPNWDPYAAPGGTPGKAAGKD